jgi:AhpD family alkylhydroperoxidase
MQARMKNPVMVVPEALQAVQALAATLEKAGAVPPKTLGLMHLRASQVNGCAVCVDMHYRMAKKHGETDERLFTVAAWRETPYFSDSERAALALTEAATRIADHPEAVSDEIWEEAARHYDERGLAVLVMQIALINFFNRVNATTRQVAGAYRWDG